jgi:hypothetical protein
MTPPKAKPPGPRCHICRSILHGAKVVINGLWTCPDCAYELEYGATPTAPSASRRRRLHPQEERLFPLPPATARKRRAARTGSDAAPATDALTPPDDHSQRADTELAHGRASDS